MRKGFIVLLACWLTLFQCGAAGLSLAIIAEDETAGPAADLLMTELSDEPNPRLLERAELERIVAEQSLSLAHPRGLLRAGRLAGADALLFLDHFSRAMDEGRPPQEFLGLRLILVGPGVVLHTVDYAWPAPEITEWSITAAQHLGPHLARAGIPEGAGLKLSLLNFGSPTDSRESLLLDKELNALLFKRLAQETNVFVLERRKLGATLLERELNSEASPFWRGSYLIDGTVNKLGYSENAVSIETRVAPPGGAAAKVIELSGKRDELPGLIDKLVVEILTAADHESTGSWDAAAEAARFFNEAKWSLRWALLPEAQSAADAAWALGKRDEAAATVRVRAYGRAAEPDTGAAYGYWQGWRMHFEKPPRAEALANGISALSIFLEWSSRVPVEEAGKEWLDTGLEALRTASEVLHHYYFTPEARAGLEEELAELRGLCRDTAAWMARVPSVRAPFFLEGPAMSFDEINAALEGEHLFKTMAEYGALWQERMADALPLHEMLIKAPSFCNIREVYLGHGFNHLPLAGWTWGERKNALPMWREFLTRLEKSTNTVTRIEAAILRSTLISPDEKLYAHIREIMRLIEEHQEELGRHPSPLHYEYRLGDLTGMGSNIATPAREALRKEILRANGAVMEPIREAQWRNARIRMRHAEAAKLFDGQKVFLRERRTDLREFNELFPPFGVYPKEQAATLLVMVGEYKSALANRLEEAEWREQASIRFALSQSRRMERRLNQMLGITPPPARKPITTAATANGAPAAANQMASAPRRGPGSRFRPGGVRGREEAFVPTPIRTNKLVIGGFQEIPASVLVMTNVSRLRNTSVLPDGGNIWLRTRYVEARPETGYHPEDRGLITLFDPVKGALETIPTGFEPARYFSPYHPMRPDFQIWKGDIYAAGGSRLRRYDRARKEWRELPVPLSKDARLYVMGGRLLILNSESLLELEPGAAGVKTLASARRNPPITPLDVVTNLSAASLFAAAEGFRAWVPPSLYQFRDGSFSVLESFKPPGETTRAPGRFLYAEEAPWGNRNLAYIMGPEDDKAAALYSQRPRHAHRRRFPPRNRTDDEADTVWKGLEQFSLEAASAVFLGGDIVMWGTPAFKRPRGGINHPASVHPALELKSHLFLLSKRFKEPVVLLPEMASGMPSPWEHPKPGRRRPPIFMAATAGHLVFGNPVQPGLWFVPLAEIAKAAENAKLVEIPGGEQ